MGIELPKNAAIPRKSALILFKQFKLWSYLCVIL
jgi:hypothetical protein